MPVCPHCQTKTEQPWLPCPTNDGFYTIDEDEYARFKDDTLLGTRVSDRYVFTSVIGHGSIGRVYKGYQPTIDRHVVLKVFKLQNLLDEQLGFMPGKTPQQMIVMHQESPIPPIKPRAGLNVPDELATYIRTCLQKDPTQRYADARAALRVLEGMMARWGFLQPRTIGGAPAAPAPTPSADISADSSQDMLAVFDSIVSHPRTDTAEVSVSDIARARFNALERGEEAGQAPGAPQRAQSAAAGGVLDTTVGPASSGPAPEGLRAPMLGYTVVAPERSPEVIELHRTRNLILAAAVFAVLTFCILLFVFFFKSL